MILCSSVTDSGCRIGDIYATPYRESKRVPQHPDGQIGTRTCFLPPLIGRANRYINTTHKRVLISLGRVWILDSQQQSWAKNTREITSVDYESANLTLDVASNRMAASYRGKGLKS